MLGEWNFNEVHLNEFRFSFEKCEMPFYGFGENTIVAMRLY